MALSLDRIWPDLWLAWSWASDGLPWLVALDWLNACRTRRKYNVWGTDGTD